MSKSPTVAWSKNEKGEWDIHVTLPESDRPTELSMFTPEGFKFIDFTLDAKVRSFTLRLEEQP